MTTEQEIRAGLKLLLVNQSVDPDAAKAVDKIYDVIEAPLLPHAHTGKIPRLDLEWDERDPTRQRPGGRRSIEDYRERAKELGMELPRNIGWSEARDAVRAWEAALADVDRSHVNMFTESRWLPE